MRAARLLRILLLLQNRGRMTAPVLAAELEVTPRTILRDVDAMTEAGLPILTLRGSNGGIELGFNYRTRLTGLASDEAEALAVWLAVPPPEIAALGMSAAAATARAKLIESFPDRTLAIMKTATIRFPRATLPIDSDPRIAAIAGAIRNGLTLRLRAHSANPISLTPTVLCHGAEGWSVIGPPLTSPIGMADWFDINLSRPAPM